MSFESFSIDQRCIRVLAARKIVAPTPVQERAIPVALEGRDVVVIAQTGTGKTLAFSLPALTRLAAAGAKKNAMLVLTPTRELAVQVHAMIEPLARALGLSATAIYGGTGMQRQSEALRQGRTIVVATPGRLLDHLNRGNLRFDKLSTLVLDEADRMLDMGFMPDIRRILSGLPKERQTLLFSATFPKEIESLARDMQRDPARIEVGAVSTPAARVRQGLYTVGAAEKMGLLSMILRKPEVRSALVFIKTKHRTDRIAKALHREGFKVQAIHGGRTQRQREQAIDGFRNGHYKVLVATDVAARGLDIHGISHVVNFDLPNTAEDYVHRIGRTGRANAEGDAITFVSPEDKLGLRGIEKALGQNLPRTDWEGAVHVPSLYAPGGERPEGPRQGGGQRPHGGPRRNGGYQRNGRPRRNDDSRRTPNERPAERPRQAEPVRAHARRDDAPASHAQNHSPRPRRAFRRG